MPRYTYIIRYRSNQFKVITEVAPDVAEEFLSALCLVMGLYRNELAVHFRGDTGTYQSTAIPSPNRYAGTIFRSVEQRECRETTSKQWMQFGHRIAVKYKELRKMYVDMTRNSIKTSTEQLDLMRTQLNIIESSVLGDQEMWPVFDLWLRKQFTAEKCAYELHVGKSTWYRRCRKLMKTMAISLWIGLGTEGAVDLLCDANSTHPYLHESNVDNFISNLVMNLQRYRCTNS